jgi:hypothetical protein
MTGTPHPRVAILLDQYARELAAIEPSPDLDARIDALVANPRAVRSADPPPAPRPQRAAPVRVWHVPRWAAVACFALLAVAVGIIIGMRLEHRTPPPLPTVDVARDTSWPPAEFSMWPADSVSFKVPAAYSADGRLVAVDPADHPASARYWVDVVVSNDGTMRIEKVVPEKRGEANAKLPAN